MQTWPDKRIATILFVVASAVLVLFSLLETGEIAPDAKGDSFALMGFAGVFVLALSILFYGRHRSALLRQRAAAGQAPNRAVLNSSVANFMLFVVGLIVFLFFGLLYSFYSWGTSSEDSDLAGIVRLAMGLGLGSGLIGLVATLLGKRQFALACFIIMILPVLFFGIQ